MQEYIGKAIQFKEKIEDTEAYPEKNMRARIVSIMPTDIRSGNYKDHVYEIVFDYSEFDEYNKRRESPNYYDSYGVPRLTARDAGFYAAQEKIYFPSPQLIPFGDYFTVLDTKLVVLQEEFKTSGSEDYISWLEEKVLERKEKDKL